MLFQNSLKRHQKIDLRAYSRQQEKEGKKDEAAVVHCHPAAMAAYGPPYACCGSGS